MNVCLIGDGLISLTLAKTLINKKIKVFMYYENNRKIPNDNRTIGISSDNLDFIQKKIVKINKNLIWEINKIEIYNDQNTKEKILNFQQSNKRLFSIIKNNDNGRTIKEVKILFCRLVIHFQNFFLYYKIF